MQSEQGQLQPAVKLTPAKLYIAPFKKAGPGFLFLKTQRDFCVD